jgi:uncharacterized protein
MASPLSGLIVNVAEILRRAGNIKDIDTHVDSELLEMGEPRIAPQDVHVVLHLESTNTGIVVNGQAAIEWHDACKRCLRDVGGTAVAPIAELFQRVITDPDAYPLEGEQLNLADLVREHLVLALPDAPLCRHDCPGLCPVCGADKSVPSEANCGCSSTPTDPRWAALEGLADQFPDAPGGQ